MPVKIADWNGEVWSRFLEDWWRGVDIVSGINDEIFFLKLNFNNFGNHGALNKNSFKCLFIYIKCYGCNVQMY